MKEEKFTLSKFAFDMVTCSQGSDGPATEEVPSCSNTRILASCDCEVEVEPVEVEVEVEPVEVEVEVEPVDVEPKFNLLG